MRQRERDKSNERDPLRALAAHPASLLYLQCSWGQGLSSAAARSATSSSLWLITALSHSDQDALSECPASIDTRVYSSPSLLSQRSIPTSFSLSISTCAVLLLTLFSPFKGQYHLLGLNLLDCCIIYPYREGRDALLKAQLTPSVSLSPLISPW